MPKKLRTLKVDDADWDEWKARAAEAGLNLSEWIRQRLNAREGHSRTVRKPRGVDLAERGTGSPPVAPGGISAEGGLCGEGHPLEAGSATKCGKWGCKFYAYAR